MAEQDSVTPRLNHNTQHNYLFNVGLEIKWFNFYEKIKWHNQSTDTVFSIQILVICSSELVHPLEKKSCKTLVLRIEIFSYTSLGNISSYLFTDIKSIYILQRITTGSSFPNINCFSLSVPFVPCLPFSWFSFPLWS